MSYRGVGGWDAYVVGEWLREGEPASHGEASIIFRL